MMTNKVVRTWKDGWPPQRTSTYEIPFTQEGNDLVVVSSYEACVVTLLSHICTLAKWNMWHICHWHIIAIIYEVAIWLFVFYHTCSEMLGIYVHLAQWLCETYLPSGSHICSLTCQICEEWQRSIDSIHTCTNTYIHAYRHVLIYVCLQTYPYVYIHISCIHTYSCMSSYIHMYLHANNINVYVHSYIHVCIHTYSHAYLPTCINAYTHTNICPYTHECLATHINACIHT